MTRSFNGHEVAFLMGWAEGHDRDFVLHREVLIPSEAAAVVVRIIKEGDGRAMLDEFTLGHG